MEIDESLQNEFDEMWEELKDEITDDEHVALSDAQVTETTNTYELTDAHAFYLHVAQIAGLWYKAKLGESLHKQPHYEFDFVEDEC